MAAMEIGRQDVSKTKVTGQSIARPREGNTFAARSADFPVHFKSNRASSSAGSEP
jgi:hypothetical protein